MFSSLFGFFAFVLLLCVVAGLAKAQTALQQYYENHESNDCNRWNEVRVVIDQIIDSIRLEALEICDNRCGELIA